MNIYAPKKPKRINNVSITIAIGVVIIGGLLYWWVPILWPIFQVTGMMRTACHEAYRTMDDEKLIDDLARDAQRTGLAISKDNFRIRRIPYTPEQLRESGLPKDSPIILRGRTCEIDFRYENDFPVPLVNKSMHLVFDRTITDTLEPVKYNKLCTCVSVPGGPTR